jgi:flagellar basal body rod protein FlgB
MNLLSMITDNITDLLVKIIEFTEVRQQILTKNIQQIHCSGFVPKDLAVDEFSASLNGAIAEHIQNHRLVLRDTDNVKFGLNGNFKAKPVIDGYAKGLLEHSRDEYLRLQINKLLENSLNQKIAAELLRQRQELV